MNAIKRLVRRSVNSALASTRGRNFLLRSLANDGKFVFAECGDHSLIFDPSEFIGRQIYDSGGWQRAQTDAVIKTVRSERSEAGQASVGVFFELGANIGTQTIYAALSGAFERLIAVEPDPRNHALLCANLRVNGLDNCTEAIACAVSDVEGTADLRRNALNSGTSTLRETRLEGHEASRDFLNIDYSVEVAIQRADDILGARGVAPEDVALVWIDVEGHELRALKGMPELLKARVPVQIEYSPHWFSDEERGELVDLVHSTYGRVLLSQDGFRSISASELRATASQIDLLLLP